MYTRPPVAPLPEAVFVSRAGPLLPKRAALLVVTADQLERCDCTAWTDVLNSEVIAAVMSSSVLTAK